MFFSFVLSIEPRTNVNSPFLSFPLFRSNMGVSDGQDLGANLALHPGLSGTLKSTDK